MAIQILTARAVETASAPKETLLADGDNLYLRLRPGLAGGKCLKHWLFIYTDATKRRRKLMLGAYPTFSLATARKWAAEQNSMIGLGTDPGSARKAKKAFEAERSINTCDSLLTGYINFLKSQGKTSHVDAAGIFKLHVSDKLKALPASLITHKDLIVPIRKLVDDNKLRTAAKLRSYLHAAFELALSAEDNPNAPSSMLGYSLSANPVTRIKVPAGSSKPGDRVLSKTELFSYAAHLEALPAGDTRDLLRLQLLLAGQRVAQLHCATLEDGNLVQRDNKGKRASARKHVLPLQGRANELIKARGKLFDPPTKERIVKGKLIPPSPQQDLVRASIAVGKIAKAMGGQPFRLGDIRRTAETMLAAMGFNSDLRGQLLSHGLGGVQNRHYDKHDYLPEKLKMLQAWEAFLAEKPMENVVHIKGVDTA